MTLDITISTSQELTGFVSILVKFASLVQKYIIHGTVKKRLE